MSNKRGRNLVLAELCQGYAGDICVSFQFDHDSEATAKIAHQALDILRMDPSDFLRKQRILITDRLEAALDPDQAYQLIIFVSDDHELVSESKVLGPNLSSCSPSSFPLYLSSCLTVLSTRDRIPAFQPG